MKLIYLLLISLALYGALFFIADEVISPDDLIFKFFSAEMGRPSGRLGFFPPGDELFGEEGFIPRYFVYGRDGRAYPRKFPGFIIFWAGLNRVLPWPAARLVNPLCAALSILLLFLVGRELFGPGKTALRAAVFLAATPVFIRRAFAYNPTLFNLAVFLAALLFLLRAIRGGRWRDYLGFGLFSGALLWIRPTNGVFLATFFVFLLIERRRVAGRRLLAALALILVSGAGILLFNRSVYGGYFTLGYTATHLQEVRAAQETVPTGIRGILDYLRFHPRIWILHLKNTPAALALGFPLLILALLGFIRPPRGKANPSGTWGEEGADRAAPGPPLRFGLYYLCLFAVGLAFFSNFGTFGHEENEFTLHSSFLRYLLPVISLLPLFAARFLDRVKMPPGRMMTALAGFSVLVALVAPAGMIETVMQSRYNRKVGEFLISRTGERTVFFAHYWDKVVFPERIVYTRGTHFPQETVGEVIRKVESSGWRAAYPEHPADREIGDFIREHYEFEEIVGPDNLSFLDRLAVRFIPSRLYPVRLLLVRGEKAPPPADLPGAAP